MTRFVKNKVTEYLDGYRHMPRPLQSLAMRQIAISAVFIIASLLASIALKNALLIPFSLLSLYFTFVALSNIKSYRMGGIRETVAVCTATKSAPLSGLSEVVFFSTDENGVQYSHVFRLPRKGEIVKKLYIGGTFVLYTKFDPTETLIAVEPLANTAE